MLYAKPYLLVLAFVFAAVVSAQNTIMDMLQNIPQLSTFNKYIASPGSVVLANLLSNPNANVTLFAPVDDAFDQIDKMLITKGNLTMSASQLRRGLFFHVIPDQIVMTKDLTDGFQQFSTMYSMMWSPKGQSSKVRYGIPQDVTDGLIIFGAGGSFDILRGLGIPSHIIKADMVVSNGVIHLLDRVLIPPLGIMETLKLRDLTKMADLLKFANTLDTFQSFSKITFLVPTNDAVAQFTATHPGITSDSLRNILLTHVIPGYHFSSDLSLSPPSNVPTKSGETLQFYTSPEKGSSIGDATVTKANILIDRGVLHEINKVLVPDEIRRSGQSKVDF